MWVYIEYLIIILMPLIFIGLGVAFFRTQKHVKLQARLNTSEKALKTQQTATGAVYLEVMGTVLILLSITGTLSYFGIIVAPIGAILILIGFVRSIRIYIVSRNRLALAGIVGAIVAAGIVLLGMLGYLSPH